MPLPFEAQPQHDAGPRTQPDRAAALLARAIARQRSHDFAGALADAEQAVQADPQLTRAWALLADLRGARKDLGGTIEALQRALALDPGNVTYMSNLGEYLRQAYRLDEAVELLRQAVQADPKRANAWTNLGVALQDAGRAEDARAAYETASQMQPDQAGIAMHNLAVLTAESESWESALPMFRRAAALAPGEPQVLANLGKALVKVHRPAAEVEGIARELLAGNPQSPEGFELLGALCEELRRYGDALRHYSAALAVSPGSAELNAAVGRIFTHLLDLPRAEMFLRRAWHLNPRSAGALSSLLFVLNSRCAAGPAQAMAEARRYGDLVTRPASRYTSWRSQSAPARLRIGFVSGDLHAHPVGYFLEGLLRDCDRSRFEPVAYPTKLQADAQAQRLRELFAQWTPIGGMSDSAAARRIHADGVHVLIDLSGHTHHNRLPVFAFRPAPVQATWLGYFATTGMAEVDYIIGDRHVIPNGEEGHFTESAIRLPDSYLCFTAPDYDLPITPVPVAANGHVTFGCFNNLAKMGDPVVALWSKVLHAIPGSRLFLKAKQLSDPACVSATLARFRAAGVEPGRLDLEGEAPRRDLLAAYGRVDMALDPFPYPGGTTTVEALWMGVPTLTRRGDRFLSHIGETIAINAGLEDWVAQDDAQFVAKAAAFAAAPHKLVELRSMLRARVLASPLFESPRFARGFEDAVLAMWQAKERTNVA